MTITMTMQQQDIYPSFAIEMAKLCAHRSSSDEPSSSFSSSPSSSSSSSSFSASCSSPFDLLRLSDSGARHESSPFNSPKSSLRKSQKEEDEQEEGEVSPSEDNGCRKSQEQQEQQEEEHLLKKTKITDENQPENEDSHSFCLSLVERATELKQRVSDYAQWLQLSHESYRKRITTIKRLHELLADLIQFINSLLLQQRNSVSKASFHFLLARFSREMAELNQLLADWSLFRYRPLPSRTIEISEMRLTSWFAQLSHMFPLHFLPQLPTLSDSYRAPLSAPSTPLRSSSDSPLLSSPPSPSVLSPPPSPCPSPCPTLPSSSSTASSSSSSLLSTPSLLSVPPPSSPLVESHPALLIQDLKARSAWEQAFGPFCAFVTIDTFLSQLICGQLLNIPPVSRISAVSTYSSISCSVFSPTFHSSSSSSSSSSSVSFSSTMTKTSTTVWPEQSAFLDTLRRVLSSSGQSVVTTYQWGQLVQMFGPMDHFLRNFSEFATNGAFFGYLHREEAHSILKNSPSNRVVLLRYSTTCPDFIAFSFKNSRGEIRHLLNQDERGQPIPVHRFFPAYFSAYSFVRP